MGWVQPAFQPGDVWPGWRAGRQGVIRRDAGVTCSGFIELGTVEFFFHVFMAAFGQGQ
jgi:hypothetical protein